jgi:NAD-dependent deacetylase
MSKGRRNPFNSGKIRHSENIKNLQLQPLARAQHVWHPSSVNIIILTGAGISAESGLATFRGGDGLWDGHRIDDICTPEALDSNRALVHRFYDERRSDLKLAKPNPAHNALARLERHWESQQNGNFLLVTQNVDDLHERAGSRNLIHMHGELNSVLCEGCGARKAWHLPLPEYERCPSCRRDYLRPDIVFFGEMPYQMDRIHEALRTCDLFLSVGTSGTVYPASQFVMFAKDAGAEAHLFNTNFVDRSKHFEICHIDQARQALSSWVNDFID